MLGVAARSFISSHFVRSIASSSYRNVAAAAAQESSGEDILTEPEANEEDKIVKEKLTKVLVYARKKKKPPGEALETYDGPFTLEGVSKVMWGTRDVQTARAVIDWACRQPGFYYTSRLMSNILRGLNVGGQLDEAKKLVFEELKEKFKPTPTVYRSLAKHYMAADKRNALQELVEEMQKQGIEPDDTISKLEATKKESGVEEMLQLFRDNPDGGHITEELIFRLCASKMWTEALEVYSLIRGMATERCMTIFIKELLGARKLDEAYSVTKHLLDRGFKSSPPFKRVINALCANGRLDEAYEIFKEVYDRVSLKGMTLVPAFCKAGNVDMAMDVLHKLKAPDKEAAHFKAVIVLLCKVDRLEDAKKVMDQMLEAGISPDSESCNLLAKEYAKTLPEDDPRRKKFASKKKKAEQI